MATLSKQGTELFRYLSPRHRGLISVRSNGVNLYRTPFSNTWKVLSRKKPEVSLETWKNKKHEIERNLKPWQRVKSIPSLQTLEAWAFDGVAESTAGATVEPDGYDEKGNPSWLLALGMI